MFRHYFLVFVLLSWPFFDNPLSQTTSSSASQNTSEASLEKQVQELLPARWAEMFKKYKSAAEQGAFFENQKMRFRFVTVESELVNASDFAKFSPWEPNTILINADELSRMINKLVEIGFPKNAETITFELSLTLFPTVAHEVQHAINCAAMKKAIGQEFYFPFFEEEMLGRYVQLLVAKEIQLQEPHFWVFAVFTDLEGSSGEVLHVFEGRGKKGVLEVIRPTVSLSLEEEPEKLLSVFRQEQGRFSTIVGEVESERKKLAGDAVARRAILDVQFDAYTQSELMMRKNVTVLETPDGLAKIRAFYKAALASFDSRIDALKNR